MALKSIMALQLIKKPSIRQLVAYTILTAVVGIIGFIGFQMLTFRKGYIYVLQQQDQKINLVKTKLDGSESKVAVNGTGKETLYGTNATVILASQDWNYIAMRSLRDNGNPKIYVYDARANKLKELSNGQNSYEFVGWINGRFIYITSITGDNKVSSLLKSYDPATDKTLDIKSIDGRGIGTSYIIGKRLVYDAFPKDESAIYSVNADGSDSKKLQAFKSNNGDGGIITSNIYEPKSVFFSFYQSKRDTLHFKYTNDSLSITNDDLANQQKFRFYITSPSGKKTAWYENKDSQNQLFVGDGNGQKGKVKITLPVDYKPYAWYGENTLLIAKGRNKPFGPPTPKTLYTLNPWTGKLKEVITFIPSGKPFNIAMAGYPGSGYGYAGIFDF